MADGPTSSVSTPPQRIAFFADDARVFPEELTGLLEKLAASHHRVRCFAPDWPDHVAKLATASGVETDTYPIELDENWSLMRQRALRKKLANLVTAWAPDQVIAIGPASALRILPTIKPGQTRRIAILDRFVLETSPPPSRSTSDETDRTLNKAKISELAKVSDIIICHTNQDRQALASAMENLPPAQNCTVHALPGYGVNTTVLKHQHLPPTAGAISFLMTAPMDHWKGVLEYSAAASLVTGRNSNAVFRLQSAVGRTPNAIAREQIFKSNRITPVETSVGLAQAIAQAHVVVVASHYDGMPRELLAALALGRPLICADISGSREAIDERMNGIIFERANPNALADACESLLRRPELLTAMGRSSRQKAERRFSEDAVLRSYLSLMGLSA
ncbi:MAG: glycosyltransferase [Pseudomonadota bacterium]